MTPTPSVPSSRPSPRAAARLLAASLTALALSTALPARASWPHDPATGLQITSEPAGQPLAVSDGAGGVVVVYSVYSPLAEISLYARHVAADGTLAGGPWFVAAMSVPGVLMNPVAASDGAGGVFVAWQQHEYSDVWGDEVYVQHMLASGSLQGPVAGYKVCSSTAGEQVTPVITGDANGGAWIAWADSRANTTLSDNVYLQHVGSLGSLAYPAGLVVCTQASTQRHITIAPDGFSGVLVAWDDYRNLNRDVYVQRVSITGSPMWLADGVQMSTRTDAETLPSIVGDGAGGAIVSWVDDFVSDARILARSITAAGAPRYPSTGVDLCPSTVVGLNPALLVPDGVGGAFAAFEAGDFYAQSISVQHFTPNNAVAWGAYGVGLGPAAVTMYGAQMIPDGAGGVIITWLDKRTGTFHLYGQRLNDAGQALWAANGVAVCTAGPGQQDLPQLVADGAGNAIAVWQDARTNPSLVYGQRVDALGQLGDARPRITSVRDHPSDQGGVVDLSWSASDIDANPSPGVTEYRLWRSAPAMLASAKARGVTSDPDEAVASGRLYAPASAASGYAWEYLLTVPATQAAGYTHTLATTTDSMPAANRRTAFLVQARKPSAPTPAFWFSAADSGYSVDNLPPARPSPFVGAYAPGATHLSWGPNADADLSGYRLYRGSTSGFVPGPANLVVSKPDTGYVDVTATAWFYKLVAVDIHGNASLPVAVAPPGLLAVDADGGAPFALTAPHPNPARGAATLRWTQPLAGHVRLALFDLAGRQVRSLVDGMAAAGAHESAFELLDDSRARLAPGVYLVRLDAVGRSAVSRMVVIR